MSPEAVARNGTTATNVMIPVEVVCWDEATSQALASHHEKGGSLIIEARCFIEHQEVGGRMVPSLRVVAEQIMFVNAPEAASHELPDQRLRLAS